jgi:hypothetical protein
MVDPYLVAQCNNQQCEGTSIAPATQRNNINNSNNNVTKSLTMQMNNNNMTK